MRQREFTKYYERYLPTLKAIARKLAGRDDELAEDLQQEGAMLLWSLDPTKASKNLDAWIRKAIYNRMVGFLRAYDPQKYESLDARLESGDQLEQLEDTGEVVLFTSRPAPPRLMDDDTAWQTLEENEEL